MEETRSKDPRLSPEYDISDFDEKTIYLVGWPGYRNARGRSGLGQVETQAEWAHMKERMLLFLITGRFKTRNPVFLVFLKVFGIIQASPIALLFAGHEGGRHWFRTGSSFFSQYIGWTLAVDKRGAPFDQI